MQNHFSHSIAMLVYDPLHISFWTLFFVASEDNLAYASVGTKLRETRTVSGTTTTLDWRGDVVLEQVGPAACFLHTNRPSL